MSTQQSRAHGSVGTAPEEALTPTSTLADTDTNAGTVTKADTFASLDAVANTDGNADGDRSTSTGGTVPKGTQRRALLAASVTLVLWASAFVVIRMVGSAYSAGGLAFGRMASAAVVLGVIAVLRHQVRVPDRRALFPIVGYGVAWFGGYTVVLNLAEQHLDAGTASLLVNVAPLLVAVFAGFLLGEGFPRSLLVGLAIGFSGVALIAAGGTGHGTVSDGVGIVLGLFTALLYALGILLQKVALRRVGASTATFLGAAIGAVVLLPFAPAFIRETAVAPGGAILGALYLGVFPAAIGFTAWAYALARSDAGRLTATTLSVPAIAILLSWLLLGELPTVLAMVGGALCLFGVAWSRRR